MADLEQAVGQFVVYDHLLKRYEPDRTLFLAVPEDKGRDLFSEEAGETIVNDRIVRLVFFDSAKEEIVEWIP